MRIDAKYLKVGSENLVVLSAKDYELLAKRADLWEPRLPNPEGDGNYPLEAIDVVIARGIVRDRRELGWTQTELARRAGIRVATLKEIEQGNLGRRERAVDKIDRAFKAAKKANGKHRPKHAIQ